MNEIILERILKVLQESKHLEATADEIQAKIEYGAIELIEKDLDELKKIAIKMDLLERELHYLFIRDDKNDNHDG